MPKFLAEFNGGRSVEIAVLLFVGFLKIKNTLASFSPIFENTKGFLLANMKRSVISVLEVNSRYLEYPHVRFLLMEEDFKA